MKDIQFVVLCSKSLFSFMSNSKNGEKEMTAILLGETDFESIRNLVGPRYWENSDLKYPFGYWIPASILQTVPSFGSEILPLIESPNLPVFYGNMNVDQFVYGESLTCLCKSRENGSDVQGVSILPPYWYESQYFEFKRCFRYQELGDSEHCWRIVSGKADIEWLTGCWDKESQLYTWLRQNTSIHLKGYFMDIRDQDAFREFFPA